MKIRHEETEEDAFITALDKINDLVCTTIQERYSEQLREKEGEELMLLPPEHHNRRLTDKEVARFRKIMANSPRKN